MTAWLLAQGHMAFVTLAYLVGLIALLVDYLPPGWREKRLLAELAAALARQRQRRERTEESGAP